MKIENISSVSIPFYEGDLTEITTDHEFINQDKDWYWEQFFIDANGNVAAKFVQLSSKDYSGRASQLSQFRQDIFIVDKKLTEHCRDYQPCDIVKIVDGEVRILHSYDYIEEGEEDKTFIVKKDGLYGFIDINGDEIIPPQYKKANSFSGGLTVAKNSDNKCGLINKKNEALIPFIYDDVDIYGMSDGYCIFYNYDKTGKRQSFVYNKDYKLVLEHNGDARNLANGIFAVETENKKYEIKKSGKVIGELERISQVQLPYEEQSLTQIICDKKFVETKDWYKEQNFMDETGKIAARFIQRSSEDYDGEAKQLTVKRKDLFIVEYTKNEDKSKHHYDIVQVKDLVPTVLHTYDYVSDLEEDGMFKVKKNKLHGYIDNNGVEVIKPQYGNALDFHNGLAIVKNRHKCGMINKQNEVVIPLIYHDFDNHNGMIDGYSVFYKFDKNCDKVSCIYDKDFKLVLEHKGDVQNLSHGLFVFEVSRNTYEIRDLK